MASANEFDKGPLGKTIEAPTTYCPSVLFPIARIRGRSLLGLADGETIPFAGVDIWCLSSSANPLMSSTLQQTHQLQMQPHTHPTLGNHQLYTEGMGMLPGLTRSK